MTYEQFMNSIYLPHYKSSVSQNTWVNRKTILPILINRFKGKNYGTLALLIAKILEYTY